MVMTTPGSVVMSPGSVVTSPGSVVVVISPDSVVICPGRVINDVEIVVSVLGGIVMVVREPEIDEVTVEAGNVVVVVNRRVETTLSVHYEMRGLGTYCSWSLLLLNVSLRTFEREHDKTYLWNL